jgi:hypothetical protein
MADDCLGFGLLEGRLRKYEIMGLALTLSCELAIETLLLHVHTHLYRCCRLTEVHCFLCCRHCTSFLSSSFGASEISN